MSVSRLSVFGLHNPLPMRHHDHNIMTNYDAGYLLDNGAMGCHSQLWMMGSRWDRIASPWSNKPTFLRLWGLHPSFTSGRKSWSKSIFILLLTLGVRIYYWMNSHEKTFLVMGYDAIMTLNVCCVTHFDQKNQFKTVSSEKRTKQHSFGNVALHFSSINVRSTFNLPWRYH